MFSETQLLTLPAFLPSVISFYFPKIGGVGGGGEAFPGPSPTSSPGNFWSKTNFVKNTSNSVRTMKPVK